MSGYTRRVSETGLVQLISAAEKAAGQPRFAVDDILFDLRDAYAREAANDALTAELVAALETATSMLRAALAKASAAKEPKS